MSTSSRTHSRTRPFLAFVAAAVVVALVLLAGGTYATANDWAATVDGQEISERQFLRELRQLRSNRSFVELASQSLPLLGAHEGAVPAQLSAGWLTQRIRQAVVDAELERRGIEVTDEQLAEARNVTAQQFGGDPATFEAFDEWFRERLVRRTGRFLALIDDIAGETTEAELREEYEADPAAFTEACASHVLLQSREAAREVRNRIAEGASFEDVARERSQDPQSAQQGGDLGCNRRGTFRLPALEEALFSLPVGEVSQPVETQAGFHVLRVRSRERLSFEEARPEIEQQLQSQGQQEFTTFLRDALERLDVEVNPKYGSFEVGPRGPQVVAPSAPSPPDGVPTGEGGDTGGAPAPGPGQGPQPADPEQAPAPTSP